MTKSPTSGMTIEQRILHVGGRNNTAGYVEFGSVQAVQALIQQVLRDLPDQAAQPVDARRIPEGWDIEKTSEGEVFVSSPVEGPGFMHPREKKGPLSERLLHHLAIALMNENAEAPKQ